MKKFLIFLCVVFLFSGALSVQATPLSLKYSVTDVGGGLYDYGFDLILDNNDGTWAAGQGWRWFIFGDEPGPGSTPLTDFIGDPNDLPIGPWTSYVFSSGGHNGPTLGPVSDYWVPISLGETLSWSGTSTANLVQGELLFSTIAGTLNNAVAADFEIADRVDVVPEPATLLLLGSGLVGLGVFRKKFKK